MVLLFIACIIVAFLYGGPDQHDGIAQWWDHGAQLSGSEVHSRLSRFFSDDIVSKLFIQIFEWMASIGIHIWNPLARYLLVRVIIGFIALAALYDVAKSGLQRLFSDASPPQGPANP